MTEEKPKKKRKKKPLPITITEEQFTKLLLATPSLHHKIAFLLGFESGLRISEITNLKKTDFQIELKRILIKEGKGGKDRIVALPVSWNEKLINYIPIDCSNRALQKAFELYAKRCGLADEVPKVHFHSLRHGYATHLRRQGVKLENIQKLLGHEDISTTSIYVNLTPDEALKESEEAFE